MTSETFTNTLEAEIARELTPSTEIIARLHGTQLRLVEAVSKKAKDLGFSLERALVAGSAARNTYLPGNFDIDLFLLFSPSISREKIVEQGLAIARAVLKNPEQKYAEHPYLRGEFEGFTTEIVPGYAVKSADQHMTAVDRTPFHQEYLSSRHTDRTRAEVRLLKQFLRSLKIYGAEVKTEGFSGYLMELLILRSGSFRGLLEEASGWRIPQRLAPPGKDPTVESSAALILSDPVDIHRNVSAALSKRNLSLFILASQAYLANPRREFFFPPARRKLTREEVEKLHARRGTTVTAFVFPVPGMVPDIVYPQLRKSERSMVDHLESLGFRVIGSASAVEEGSGAILIETDEGRLGPVRLHSGPPAGFPDVPRFVEKWSTKEVLQGPYLSQDGRLVVETAEGPRDIASCVKGAIPDLSLGRDLRSQMEKSGKVLAFEEALEVKAVRSGLEMLWEKRLPWLDWA
jgi:tRNA nucleotidyltransferase (CCA-adding enzyme)